MEMQKRVDGRAADEMRPVGFQAGIAPHAAGSVLVSFGNTRVICGVTYERKIPPWMQQQGIEGGWLTAEYSMLPYSTLDRKQRDGAKGKVDGRTIEIQRLIGRALRAVMDLKRMPGLTLWVDCDVLQADGGTRTASITGAYVAAQLAVARLMKEGLVRQNPFVEAVAAVSVGLVDGQAMLDLAYVEDRDADVDANIVMTAGGRYVEFHCSGEEATYSPADMVVLNELAGKGIRRLLAAQQDALSSAAAGL